MRLILASASPRRAELLRAAGYDFDVVVANVDESIRDGESPSMYVRRLAAEKSAAVLQQIVAGVTRMNDGPPEGGRDERDAAARGGADLPSGDRAASGNRVASGFSRTIDRLPDRTHDDVIVLGADTTVVVDDEILAKPIDDDEARRMLRRIAGRRHEVLTGVSLRRGGFEIGRVESTAVHVSPLGADEIDWYVSTGEGRDKAGAYAIQGFASRFIPRIEGSYSNVVGLPVACVRDLLTEISDTRRDPASPRR